MRRNSSISIAVLAILFVAASTFPMSAAAASGTRWGADYFPNVELMTQNGQKVRFYDDLLKDKIVAIALIYTHCQDTCPLETARMAQVQKMLGDRVGHDIFFYSISIDPERDTPAELKAYAEKFHAGPGWSFLTGSPQDIELISKKLGLYSPDRGRDGHAADLMIGNVAAGQWMRNSATDNPRFLALMIGQLLSGWKGRKTEAVKNYAEAPKLSISPGQYLFATHCAACHTIGGGELVGPDLLGVTEVRERGWLTRLIKTPDRVLAEKVRMPNLRLGDGDTAVLIDYLKAQTAAGSRQEGKAGKSDGAMEIKTKPEETVK